jgi:hypothetical protein
MGGALMSCGLSHKEHTPQKFRDAVACGQKFESPHFNHLCMICGNRDTAICKEECFYGPVCHFTQEEPKQVRETVAAVMAAIQDIKEDMAERGNPAEVRASTGPYGDTALEG